MQTYYLRKAYKGPVNQLNYSNLGFLGNPNYLICSSQKEFIRISDLNEKAENNTSKKA